MRSRLARVIVRWNGRWLDASYAAYCRRDKGEVPSWWPEPWTWGYRNIARRFIPLASWLDTKATGEQMVEEGWWG